MFRFIHSADIHLDSPLRGLEKYEGAPVDAIRQATRRAFENMVQLAIDENVNFIIIAGDLFDSDWRDYNTGLYFVSQMSRLQNANIPVFILKGNHDAANKISKSLPLPNNVKVFSHKKAETFKLDLSLDNTSEVHSNIALHGQSFSSYDIKDDLSLNYPKALPGYFNIGILHTCASGRDGHSAYAPCSIENLIQSGYNYWALGHVHKREILNEEPMIAFPGNIQGRHIKELGIKGCYLVEVDERAKIKAHFEELSVLIWELLELNIANIENESQLFELLSKNLSQIVEKHKDKTIALRIHLEGNSSMDSILRARYLYFVEAIRSLCLQVSQDQFWLEKVKLFTKPKLVVLPESYDGPVQELLSVISEIENNSDLIMSLSEELKDIKGRLPSELIESNYLNNIEWLNNTLPDIREILLDKLLNKSLKTNVPESKSGAK